MHVLGISCHYHDAAAALLRDGVLVAAAQEERFSRKKHDAAFPLRAIEFCLQQAGLEAADLDYVVFYEKPFAKGERLMTTIVATFPRSLGLLYSVFTAFLGFEVNEGEYKVMGMAPFGQPRYVEQIRSIMELREDGSLWLDPAYMRFHDTERAFTRRFEAVFGAPRNPKARFVTAATSLYDDPNPPTPEELRRNQYYAVLAASIQQVTGDVIIALARHRRRAARRRLELQPARRRRARAGSGGGRAAARRGRRLVPRTVRVGAARARAPLDPRRSAAGGHEGHRQHQDQVPRALPPLRAVRARREGRAVLRPRRRGQALSDALHALRRACDHGPRARHHPRGRFEPPAGGPPRVQPALSPSHREVRGGHRGSVGAQHLVQPQGRSHRQHARRRAGHLRPQRHGCAAARELRRPESEVKRLVGRGVIMLVGCLFAFVAIEIALHVAFPRMRLLVRHERLGSLPRPNMKGRTTFGGHERIVHIVTNSLGLRGPEIGPKPAGVRRVLALGDSFTFGHAVEAAEAWPAVLEGLLNARGGPRYEVVNAGVGGYGTGQELLLYEELESRVQPDLVVLGFAVVNDVLDNLCIYAEHVKADSPCFHQEGSRLTLTPPRPPAQRSEERRVGQGG